MSPSGRRAAFHLGVHYSTIWGARWMASVASGQIRTACHCLMAHPFICGSVSRRCRPPPPGPLRLPPPICPRRPFREQPRRRSSISVFSISLRVSAAACQMRCAKLWAIACDFTKDVGWVLGPRCHRLHFCTRRHREWFVKSVKVPLSCRQRECRVHVCQRLKKMSL